MTGSSPTFENCIFRGNLGTMAGAVMVQDSSPLFIRCLFVGNTAGAGGGGVCAVDGSSPTFVDCEFRDNVGATGGGLYLEGGRAEFEGCLLVENTSLSRGSGVYATEGAYLAISHCTLARNGAAGSGGAIAVSGSHVDIANTIIAFGIFGGAVVCPLDGTVAVSCTDVHGNNGGDWYGCLWEYTGVDGNFDADPLFCGDGPLLGPYTVDSASPCAPDHNAECGLVGAMPVRCGAARAGDEFPFPAAAWLGPLGANPFCGATRLRFEVSAADPHTPLRIAVCSAEGRHVKTLLEGELGAGVGEVGWDGRDAHGQECPAGVYFVYLRAGDERAVRRVVLSR